jgi:hypothetical protein
MMKRIYLSVFFALVRYMVVKITCFSSEMVLQIMKHIVMYPTSGPSSEVIALQPVVWYRR